MNMVANTINEAIVKKPIEKLLLISRDIPTSRDPMEDPKLVNVPKTPRPNGPLPDPRICSGRANTKGGMKAPAKPK